MKQLPIKGKPLAAFGVWMQLLCEIWDWITYKIQKHPLQIKVKSQFIVGVNQTRSKKRIEMCVEGEHERTKFMVTVEFRVSNTLKQPTKIIESQRRLKVISYSSAQTENWATRCFNFSFLPHTHVLSDVWITAHRCRASVRFERSRTGIQGTLHKKKAKGNQRSMVNSQC